MPGIFGIISKSPSDHLKTNVNAMAAAMEYENFFSSGFYINDEISFYGGWVCHKDSFSDCQPIFNEAKNIVMLYFGENFTDIDLFNDLKSKNHKFDRDNANYIIHIYEEQDLKFLNQLNGWFCGVIMDLRTNTIYLFNDRYGMQRIYYYEQKDTLYFSSEAKAILSVCPELRTLNMRGLGEMMCYGATLNNISLYQGIHIMPPGSLWTFKNNETHKAQYFDPITWENQTSLNADSFYERLSETLKRIVPRYFRSNQQIAISLTGGLDTRIILSSIYIPPGKYPCYTFGGMYRDCYDVKFARKVAIAIGQNHHTIKVDELFLNDFDRYAAKTIYISDGNIAVDGAPELYVNSIARDIAPIRMTGNFGGEILRNLQWRTNNRLNRDLFTGDFHNMYHDTTTAISEARQKIRHPLSFQLFATTPWLETCLTSIARSQLAMRSPFLDNDLIALMYRAAPEILNGDDVSLRLIKDGNTKLDKITTDKGLGGALSFPLSSLMQIYYTSSAKAEYLYNYGMPDWLACIDYVLKFMHFEKIFLGWHKFYHFRIWYRDQLADYLKAMLLDERTLKRTYLNRKAVENIVARHTKGTHNYTTEITQLLTLELIQRQLIEQK